MQSANDDTTIKCQMYSSIIYVYTLSANIFFAVKYRTNRMNNNDRRPREWTGDERTTVFGPTGSVLPKRNQRSESFFCSNRSWLRQYNWL